MKALHDLVFDKGLDYLVANGNKVILTDGYSASYATINSAAEKIAEYTPDALTKANGDVSGRKVTVPIKTGVVAVKTGNNNINHAHIVDTVNSVILATTEVTTKNIDKDDKVDCPAFDIELNDPA